MSPRSYLREQLCHHGYAVRALAHHRHRVVRTPGPARAWGADCHLHLTHVERRRSAGVSQAKRVATLAATTRAAGAALPTIATSTTRLGDTGPKSSIAAGTLLPTGLPISSRSAVAP